MSSDHLESLIYLILTPLKLTLVQLNYLQNNLKLKVLVIICLHETIIERMSEIKTIFLK